MSDPLLVERSGKGFSFENCIRNEHLQSKNVISMKATKTGTTIVGVTYKDGVILAADTRATEGNIVAEKNCSKIHYVSDNMYCCGAGTAADTEMVTRMVSSQIELHKLNSGRTPRVLSVLRMLKQYLFQYQGYIGAALILGGVDSQGPHLYSIAPHGSTDSLPYQTMGSGCLAALSVLETYFKENMTKEEAMKLARDAIAAGIFNDMGSGSNVDLCIITKNGVEYKRPYDIANLKGKRSGKYCPKKGQTQVLRSEIKKIEYDVMTTRVIYDIKKDPEGPQPCR